MEIQVTLNRAEIETAIARYLSSQQETKNLTSFSVIMEIDSKGQPTKATVKPTQSRDSGFYDR